MHGCRKLTDDLADFLRHTDASTESRNTDVRSPRDYLFEMAESYGNEH
jgi:hypothetical protein